MDIVDIVLCGLIYFLPVIISGLMPGNNTKAVFVLNFSLGWTVLGWIIAFRWALKYERKNYAIINNYTESISAKLSNLDRLYNEGFLNENEFLIAKSGILDQK